MKEPSKAILQTRRITRPFFSLDLRGIETRKYRERGKNGNGPPGWQGSGTLMKSSSSSFLWKCEELEISELIPLKHTYLSSPSCFRERVQKKNRNYMESLSSDACFFINNSPFIKQTCIPQNLVYLLVINAVCYLLTGNKKRNWLLRIA